MTYIELVVSEIKKKKIGEPIYSFTLAAHLQEKFNISELAQGAVAVAINRIMENGIIPNLRCYQKGIYYLTELTAFGEVPINKEKLILDKYLDNNNGYLYGIDLLNELGLTNQISNEKVIVTNKANNGTRFDKKLAIKVTPGKTLITKENYKYLQILDVLDLLDKTPLDACDPYERISYLIEEHKLSYKKLLMLADKYYGKNVIIKLAHVASTRN